MNKPIKYYVLIHPDAIKYFDAVIDTVISKEGLINCYSVTQEMHFLEIDALYRNPTDPDHCVHISLPYSLVLYVISSPNVDLKNIYGFRKD